MKKRFLSEAIFGSYSYTIRLDFKALDWSNPISEIATFAATTLFLNLVTQVLLSSNENKIATFIPRLVNHTVKWLLIRNTVIDDCHTYVGK